MKYVSGYINKKGYNPESNKRPPYGRSSCGLPDNLTGKEIVKMCKTGKIAYNGRKFSVPRIWRKRYHDIWDYFKTERDDLHSADYINNFDPNKHLTPSIVSAMMDNKEMLYSLKRAKKKNRMI